MKNVLKYILALVFPMCCLWACSGEDDPIEEPEKPTIELIDGNTSFVMEADGGTLNVKFKATEDWKASSNCDWCKPVESEGKAGTLTLVLNVEPNEEFDGREAIVTLALRSGKDDPVKFLVKQAERGAVIISMKHTNWENFTLPGFLGDDLSGTINWGDGKQEDLENAASHSYGEEKEYTVTVELKGANKVTWQNIVGLTEVDLSAF